MSQTLFHGTNITVKITFFISAFLLTDLQHSQILTKRWQATIVTRWGCDRERYPGTDLADQLSDHAVPRAVGERHAVLAVRDLVDVVLEAQRLGQGVQHVDGEALVPLGLAQDVLRHHDERLLLFTMESPGTRTDGGLYIYYVYFLWLAA